MLPEPIAVTLQVTTLFEKMNVPYLLGGSFASAVHGTVRTTQDSDILAEMNFSHINDFVQALQPEFYVDDLMIKDAIQRKSSFNIIHKESMFKVDIFISRQRPFEQSQLSRAQDQLLSKESQVTAKVCTAEDIILAKLEWYRFGGEVSERQWQDVLGIVRVQEGKLDFEYLRKWAVQLQISDLLEAALTQD
jgi:hypothetical protein